MGFVVWMLFFDKNDAVSQYDRYQELKDLQQSAAYYKKQIASSRQEIKDLQNNPHYLEKTAREKYYLKRDNEDVYIIEDK
jgi:cell division protein DivIC